MVEKKSQKMAPPFKQIAVAVTVHPPYGSESYEAVYGLDQEGRVWRLMSDGWSLVTPHESELFGWEPEE